MNKFEYLKPCIPPNFGWVEAKLSTDIIGKISKSLDISIQKNVDHSANLVGHLYKEISIIEDCGWFFEDVLVDLMGSYSEFFSENKFGDMMTHRHPASLLGMWANFQRKNDFNQLHFHGGAYSFVIFLNIPTNWEEQNKEFISKNKNPCISDFVFAYSDILGELKQYHYRLSPEDNGKILFFPAKLYHMVYPFYRCDDDRITISGNIGLDSTRYEI